MVNQLEYAAPLEAGNHEALTYRSRKWSSENVLHVYPRTFNESRAEGEEDRGIGSILGITEKLDWMAESGITAIWLGPIYESPGLDANYDVSDYYKVNPELGTMDDVKELLGQAHARDIRVIFDLVPNHTSDQSEWFKASADPAHPDHERYKNYYIWQDARPGELPGGIVGEDRLEGVPAGYTVPNNWSSIFSLPQIDKVREQHGGELPEGVEIPAVTAWVWNDTRKQFYLAEFMKEQPSLDWSNPEVREEIKDVVRFWLDLGVDSFRVDVMNHIGKDTELKDEKPAPRGNKLGDYVLGMTNPHDQNRQERLVSHWPQLGDYTSDLLSVLDEPGREHVRFVLEDWMSALGDDKRLDALRPDIANVFNFEMLLNTSREHWSAENIGRIIKAYYARMQTLDGAVPNQVTGNHDTDTIRTRLGSKETARAAYLLLAALPGAFYTWQGDMMGRPNMIVPPELQKDGDIGQRDPERIPMQWDGSKNAGFSKADAKEMWLPPVDEAVYARDNLAIQAADEFSPYRIVADTLRRRKEDSALREGGIRMLHTDNKKVLAFAREDPDNLRRQVICVVNMSQDTVDVSILDTSQTTGRITLSASGGRETGNENIDFEKPIRLAPDAAYLIDSVA